MGQWPLYVWAEAGPGKNEDNQAAAIGSGKGGCCNISISNAELVTSANHQGADIGGGSGAGVQKIDIQDCPKVQAYSHSGAGIGGGSNGGATTIEIELTEDETTPRGYMGFPGDSHYYVHAEGGEGAAGIGGGGSAWSKGQLFKKQ